MSQKVSLFYLECILVCDLLSILSIGRNGKLESKNKTMKKKKNPIAIDVYQLTFVYMKIGSFIGPFCWNKIERIRSMFQIEFE